MSTPSTSEPEQIVMPVSTIRDEDIDPALRALGVPAPPAPAEPPSFVLPSPSPSPPPSNSREPSPPARALLAESDNTTWAARNPTRPILNPRPAPARLTEAQKASKAIAREQKKANAKRLDDDIKRFTEEQHAKLEEIARTHNIKVEKVKDLVGVSTHYKKSRKPTLHNAILHAKAMEVNQDLPPGQKVKMSELKALAADDEAMQNLTPEEEQDFIDKLTEFREQKTTGVRANNAAAARDMLCTSDSINRQLDNLALRTGSYGCVFLVRGHVNDTAAATWYGSHNSMDFWEDVMNLDPDEICRLFEQWACSRHQNVTERDTLANVRRQCTRNIQSGLRSVTNVKKLKMNYVNYETSIVQTYSVCLVGWPKAVKFVNPSQIGTVLEIRTLRDDLNSGACHWVKLTKSQLAARIADIETRRDQGETIGKKRKKRSDAGTSHKRKRPSANQENERPSRRSKNSSRKKAGTQRVRKSMAVIDSSDNEDEDDEDEDNEESHSSA